jgi:hypothetical protein
VIIFLVSRPIPTRAAFALVDVVVIFLLATICFIPIAFTVRSVRVNRS